MQVPKTEREWERIARHFKQQWNFPNCIGAMDRKHVLIQPPPNSGSYYFNYKHSFSVHLLALVDGDYKFVYVDVGCNGRVADGGVFRNSSLYAALEEKILNIPPPKPIEENGQAVPFVIVADDAFPLRNDIMKPFSQARMTNEKRIFNYRLSRARRIVENAFGILSNRFRVFMTPMRLSPEKVETIVLACCTLHNFLRSSSTSRSVYTPLGSFDSEDTDTHSFTPGAWRRSIEAQGLVSLIDRVVTEPPFLLKEFKPICVIISIQRRGQTMAR